ncbi:MAG: hypothetical protein K9J16_08405 [Melioribacteraceae bacterium]|nr:hypothetical protein [Melioribacteraceae bacterium]MCF8353154.1 hypothetical protein [Melioribacteraceae bacterium]MCF8393146.1 hypothetical protein [Melioribacteraceae bacterium]MCF8418049.1 hypothetical protein [Melioribacteraceae bacterium]
MLNKFIFKPVLLILLITIGIFITSCETGVEDSPEPGILRISLQADPNDTYAVNRSDTFSVFTPYQINFNINTFQGAAFQDDNFAVLYRSIQSYQQEDSVLNIVEFDFSKLRQNVILADTIISTTVKKIADSVRNGKWSLDQIEDPKVASFVDIVVKRQKGIIGVPETTDLFKVFTLFESFIPPGDYNKVRFGIGPPTNEAQNRVHLEEIDGKQLNVPLQLPEGEPLLLEFEVDYKIEAGKKTQLTFYLSPFKSISRYRDSYHFGREIKYVGVEYF